MVGLCALCVLCVTILLPQRVQEYNKNMLSTEGKNLPWTVWLEWKVSAGQWWKQGELQLNCWLEQTAEWDGDNEREHQKWKSRSKKAGQDVCAQCQATEPGSDVCVCFLLPGLGLSGRSSLPSCSLFHSFCLISSQVTFRHTCCRCVRATAQSCRGWNGRA